MKLKYKLLVATLATFSLTAMAGNFPGGWCTTGVQSIKGYIPWNGDAMFWLDNAMKSGILVLPTSDRKMYAAAGAIAVFGSAKVNGYKGHVAVSTGRGTFIDMNGAGSCDAFGKCSSFGKFNEVSAANVGGGAPLVGYIFYGISKVCPPKGSSWYTTNHPSCQ